MFIFQLTYTVLQKYSHSSDFHIPPTFPQLCCKTTTKLNGFYWDFKLWPNIKWNNVETGKWTKNKTLIFMISILLALKTFSALSFS